MAEQEQIAPLTNEVNQIQQRLVDMVRRLASAHAAGVSPEQGAFAVTLRLRLDPAKEWMPCEDHVPLYRQLTTAVDNFCAATDAFQQGRVYCYRLRSAQAAEAVPPTPTSVFVGYSSTGMPEWKEFHQYALDSADERVDVLFATPPQVISIVTLGRVLKSRMVSTLGKTSRSYNVLGQVAAGYYAISTDAGERDKLAVTLQVVECREPTGLFRLELNVIGMAPGAGLAVDLVAQEKLPAVYRACQTGQRELREIERAVRALPADATSEKRSQLLGRVPSVLGRMADVLEQAGRQASRRTRHAEQRKDQMRPVPCANDDATRASDQSVMIDEEKHTCIIRGPRNRIHVFTFDGRHVTTFTLQDDQVDQRIQRKKWRPAQPDEITGFRTALQKQLQQSHV